MRNLSQAVLKAAAREVALGHIPGLYRKPQRLAEMLNSKPRTPSLFPSYIAGMPLLNAHGDIDPSSEGFLYTRDTLSYIRADVVEQKFYEVAPGDYMPMDVGEAAWSSEIVQNLEFLTGGSFFEGDVNQLQNSVRLSGADAAIAPIRMPTQNWASKIGWTVFEIFQAAQASKWDVVRSKMASLKKKWDLGIQEVGFLGHPTISTMTGLLTDSQVTVDTTTIAENISSMTAAQFAALVQTLLGAYFTNSNSTELPDTFVMPTDDYLGLGVPVSSTYPNVSMISYLIQAFREMTAKKDFKILPLAYSMTANNASRGISKQRYILYKDDPNTLKMSIPVDFTMLEADTTDKLNWSQAAYGQYSGVLINRKREVMYFDHS